MSSIILKAIPYHHMQLFRMILILTLPVLSRRVFLIGKTINLKHSCEWQLYHCLNILSTPSLILEGNMNSSMVDLGKLLELVLLLGFPSYIDATILTTFMIEISDCELTVQLCFNKTF